MISEHNALQASTPMWLTRTRRSAVDGGQVVAISTAFTTMRRILKTWASAPMLPYGALWEASVIVNLLNEPASFKTQRSAIEMPRLTDSWLRG